MAIEDETEETLKESKMGALSKIADDIERLTIGELQAATPAERERLLSALRAIAPSVQFVNNGGKFAAGGASGPSTFAMVATGGGGGGGRYVATQDIDRIKRS